MEAHPEGPMRPIVHFIRRLTKPELNYDTTHCDCLSVVLAVTYLRSYLECVCFMVLTDHQTFKGLLDMSDAEVKLARLRFRLQEFYFDVVYCSGIVNRATDALSCLDSDAVEPTELDDDTPTLPVIASNQDSEEQGEALPTLATNHAYLTQSS